MKFGDDRNENTKEYEEILSLNNLENIDTSLSIADKILNIVQKVAKKNGRKYDVVQATVLLQALQEETKQKANIIYGIIELRKIDRLSEDEFRLMMLAYNSIAKIW